MEKVKNLFKNKAFLIALVGVVSLSIIATGTYAWFTTSSADDTTGAALTAAELGVEFSFDTGVTDTIKLLPSEDVGDSLEATLKNTGNRDIIARVNLFNADGVSVTLADGTTKVDLANGFNSNGKDWFAPTLPYSTTTVTTYGTYFSNLILPTQTSLATALASYKYMLGADGYLYIRLVADVEITIDEGLIYGIAGQPWEQNILQGATITLAAQDESKVQAVQDTEAAVKDVFGDDVVDFFFPTTP